MRDAEERSPSVNSSPCLGSTDYDSLAALRRMMCELAGLAETVADRLTALPSLTIDERTQALALAADRTALDSLRVLDAILRRYHQ